jgi:hypothetical protein
MTTIILTSDHLQTLNLAPVETLVLPWLEKAEIVNHEQTLEFTIDYPRDPTDPVNYRKSLKYGYGLFVWMLVTHGFRFY